MWRSDLETHSLWAEVSVGDKELENKMRIVKGNCCEDLCSGDANLLPHLPTQSPVKLSFLMTVLWS